MRKVQTEIADTMLDILSQVQCQCDKILHFIVRKVHDYQHHELNYRLHTFTMHNVISDSMKNRRNINFILQSFNTIQYEKLQRNYKKKL